MKILFDHQIYVQQNYGGISAYFYELSKGLPQHNIAVENTTLLSDNVYTKEPIYNTIKLPNIPFKGKKRVLNIIDQFWTKSKFDGDFDVFHPTYYDTYFINKIKKPFVITFYDLIHEKFASRFKELETDMGMQERRKVLLEQATKVVAISQSTKNDIIQYYDVEPSKIEVIHLATSLKFVETNTSNQYGDYILYVGTRMIYKNFKFFVEAIQSLLVKEKQLKIVCAGGGAFSDDEKKFFLSLGLLEQLVQVNIESNDLSTLYKNARLFVFPSLYEGFGIPVLEAFACGCPAVISEGGSLPEIGKEAALYFDPNSKDDMLDKISSVIYHSTLNKELVIAGHVREKEFAWDRTVTNHKKLYQSIA